jgi:hypothetical protein
MCPGMLGAHPKGIRRKFRARRPAQGPFENPSGIVVRRRKRARPSASADAQTILDIADSAVAITTACSAAIAGFEVCARRSRDARTAVAARNASEALRVLFAAAIVAAEDLGIDAHPRKRTCDRLRWEWLASTATVVDGNPDGRLLSECARVLSELVATDSNGLGDEIAARIRIASAEAHSLALAVEYERRRELAFALV